jgi:DNA repair protein RadC
MEESNMLNSQFKSLMANILREKSGSYVTEEIFKRFPSIIEIMNATEEELTGIVGVGPSKAKAIVSALQLARTLTVSQSAVTTIRSPSDVFDLVKWQLMHLKHEEFRVLFLNTKNHVIANEVLSMGSLNASIVHPREVFRESVKRSSASIICVHNHPSGDPSPSQEDISMTTRLVEAGSIIGIEVLDHIVIGHENWISLKEKGFM